MSEDEKSALQCKEGKYQIDFQKNKKGIIGFSIAVFLFLLLYFIPNIIPDMPVNQQRVLAVLAFTITNWITRPYMPALGAVWFIMLIWGLGLATDKEVLYGYGDTTPWFLYGGLTMALAVRETNLHKRISYFLLAKASASTSGVVIMQYLVHLVLAFMIPSTTARVTTTAPIAASQVEALGLPIKSRAGKMMMISIIMAPFLYTRISLTGGTTQITAWGILKEAGYELSWLFWASIMVFPCVVGAAIMFVLLWFLFRPEKPQIEGVKEGMGKKEAQKVLKDIAQTELKKLGKMKKSEKKVAVIIVCAIILWCTDKIHGLSPDLIGIGLAPVLSTPVIGVLKAREAFRRINWSNVVFVGAALSIGQVTEKSGVGKWLGGVLEPILNLGGSEITFLLLLLVLGFIGRLLLRSGAACAAVLLVPMVNLAQSLGYHATLVGVMFPLILAGIFIYQHTYGIVCYDYGAFEEPDFIKASFMRYIALIIAICAAYYIYWPIIGAV